MGSAGKFIAGVAGGVVGFVGSGFNPYGAVAGYTVGTGLANAIDPEKAPEVAAPDLSAPIATGKTYQQKSDIEGEQIGRSEAAINTPQIAAELNRRAMGQGPSLAEAQLKGATNRNLAQQLATAASMRGRNPGAAQRQILQQQGEAGRNLASDSAEAKIREQNMAQQLALQQGNALTAQQAQNIQQGYTLGTNGQFKQAELQAGTDRYNAQIGAANAGSRNNLMGSLISAGASMYGGGGGGGMGDGSGWTTQSGDYDQVFASKGGIIPGKPVVNQDSPKNDFVKALVSPGEIVVPRSAAAHPEKAKKFIDDLFASQSGKESTKKKKDKKDSKLGAALASKRKQ